MTMKRCSKLLAWLLTIIMVINMMPVTVFAAPQPSDTEGGYEAESATDELGIDGKHVALAVYVNGTYTALMNKKHNDYRRVAKEVAVVGGSIICRANQEKPSEWVITKAPEGDYTYYLMNGNEYLTLTKDKGVVMTVTPTAVLVTAEGGKYRFKSEQTDKWLGLRDNSWKNGFSCDANNNDARGLFYFLDVTIDSKVAVEYNWNGPNEGIETVAAEVGSTVTLPNYEGDFIGRELTGWKCNADNQIYKIGDTYTLPDVVNVRFTAQWEKREVLAFDKNGGDTDAPASVTIKTGVSTVTLPDYTGNRTDYRFIGWAKTNKSYSSVNKDPFDVYPAGSVYQVEEKNNKLYAVWDYVGSVAVKFNIGNAPGAIEAMAQNVGGEITLPDYDGDYIGKELTGWKCSIDGNTYGIGDNYTLPDVQNVQFTAVWANRPKVTFNANGGSEEETPTTITIKDGVTSITLPDYNGTKEGYTFTGWSRQSKLFATTSNVPSEVYRPGTEYKVKGSNETLYAVWSGVEEIKVEFGIRIDGTIPKEPGNYDASDYSSHVKNVQKVKEWRWVVDTSTSGAIEGNHVVNAVTKNLEKLPTDDELKEIFPSYDPESQYILWYVMKHYESQDYYHVDGVVLKRDMATVTYDNNTLEKVKVPLGYQVKTGTTIKVGAEKGKTTASDPVWQGYNFVGWNTQADGQGTSYNTGDSLNVDSNVTLYSIWSKGKLNVSVKNQSKEGNALTGASYKLSKGTTTITTLASNGSYDGLENDTIYSLDEVQVPSGCSKLSEKFYFKVAANDNDELVMQVCDKQGKPLDAPEWLIISDATVTNGITQITITVKDQRNSYKVSYKYTGTVPTTAAALPEDATVDYGENVTIAEAPAEVEGYTFEGWSRNEAFNMPDADVEITGSWKINEHILTIVKGNGEDDVVITDNYGTAIPTQEDPVRTGYTFTGWSQPIPETMPDENLTITAEWQINPYTITFDTNGGTTIAPITQDYDSAVAKPEDPTRAGYAFAGWDKQIPSKIPAENVTITGTFTANTNTAYKVEHYQQDLEGNYPATATETETLTGTTDTTATAAAKTYAGFTFDANAEGNVLEGNIDGDGSRVLKLYYTRNTYNIIYTVDGEAYQTVEAKYGSEHSILDETTKPGYTFSGWKIGDNDAENFSVPVDGETITGTFTANTNTAYKVEHYQQDLEGNYPATATETENLTGTTDTKATATAKTYEGFTFDASATGNVLEGNINGDGSLVLKLYYTRNIYTITWQNGDTVVETQVAYGAVPQYEEPTDQTEQTEKNEKTEQAVPTKAEDEYYTYKFVGWNIEPSTVTGQATYVAVFEPVIKPQVVYNFAQVEGDSGWYRLSTTSINAKKPVEAYGPTGNGKLVPKTEYEADDYDFTTQTILYKGQTYEYFDEEEGKTAPDKYYTYTLTQDVAAYNKVSGSTGNWIIPDKDEKHPRYTDPENKNTFHRNYKITIHYSKVEEQTLYNFVGIEGKTTNFYRLNKTTVTAPDATLLKLNTDLDTKLYKITTDPYVFTDLKPITVNGVTYYYQKNYTPEHEDVYVPYYTVSDTYKIRVVTAIHNGQDREKWYENDANQLDGEQWTDPLILKIDGKEVPLYHRNYTAKLHTPKYLPVKLVADSDTETIFYDGDVHTVPGYKVYYGDVELTGVSFDGVSTSASEKNVGTYDNEITGATVYETIDTTGKYMVTEIVNGSMVIHKKALKLESGSANKAYDGNVLTNADVANKNANGLIIEEGWAKDEGASYSFSTSILLAGQTETNAFEITANEGTNLDNYELTKNEGNLAITDRTEKYEITVTANSSTENVYDGKSKSAAGFKTLTFTVDGNEYTVSGLKTSDPSSTDVAKLPNEISGTAVVSDKDGNDVTDQFIVNTEDGTLEITRLTVHLWAQDNGKTYGDETEPVLVAEPYGLVGTDTLNYTVIRKEGENVDKYDISIELGENPNYDVITHGATFSISPKDVKLTAVDTGKTYGADDPKLTAVPEGLVGNDTLDYTVIREAGENVGDYDISIELGENRNYEVTPYGATFTISRKDVKLTAVDTGKIYGAGDPQLTAVPEGLVGNDTLDYTVIREEGENVGDYDISIELGENPNYDVTPIGANFHISPKAVTLTAVDNGKTYGDEEEPELTANAEGMVGEDTLNYTLTRAEGENVGDYDISVELGENPNYDVTSVGANFHISPRAATLRAVDNGKTYGDDDPELIAEPYGLVGMDTLNYTVIREEGENVDDYDISIELGENPNYDVTTYGAVFSISPKAVTLTADAKSKTYGESDPQLTAVPDGLVGNDTLDYTVIREAGENAGTYTIKPVAGSNQNYTVEAINGTFTIDPKPVTVTANNAGKVYGAQDPESLTASVRGLVGSDTLNYTVSRDIGENAGGYAIRVTAGENPNYTVTTNDGVFTITRKAAKVSANKATKIYGDADPNLTAVVTGTVNGDVLSYSFTRDAGEDAGEYAIDVNLGSNPNYEVETEGNILTILPVPVTTVTVNGNRKLDTYDATEHTANGYTFTATHPLYSQDNFTFTGEAEAKRTELGTTDMGLTAEQFANISPNFTTVNFVIGLDGNETIVPVDQVQVTIVGHRETVTYDGNEHVQTGYDVYTSNDLYTADLFTFTGEAVAAQTNAGTTYMGLTAEQFTNNSPNFTNVTFEVFDGYQTVVPANVTVTITGHQESVNYDGEEHTVSGYEFDSSNPLYTEADFTFSGTGDEEGEGTGLGVQSRSLSLNTPGETPTSNASQTDAGRTDMGLKPEQFENTNPNFNVEVFEVIDGYVEIVPIPVTVTIRGNRNDNTIYYNASEQMISGYTPIPDTSVYPTGLIQYNGTQNALQAKGTNAGTYSMSINAADFSSVPNENFSEVTFTVDQGYLKISPRPVTFTAENKSKTYSIKDEKLTYKIEGMGLAGGDVIIPDLRRDDGESVGNYTIHVTTGSDPNYDITPKDGTYTITPWPVTVTADNKIKQFGEMTTWDAEKDIYTATVSDVAPGEDKASLIHYSFERDAGENVLPEGQGYEIRAKGDRIQGNYSVTFNPGMLTIEPEGTVIVTITGKTGSYTYDGNQKDLSGYEFKANDERYQKTDISYNGEASNTELKGTNAGTYRTNMKAEEFVNNSLNFEKVVFEVQNGELTIKPRTVTLTSADDTKVYDGTPLTNDIVTESGDKFLDGDGVNITVTGRITEVGKTANTFTYTLKKGMLEGNYKIKPVYGTLTVTEPEQKHRLTIIYQIRDGEVLNTYTHDYAEGEKYSIATPKRKGYKADIRKVAGTMHTEDVEVLVTYSPVDYKLTVRFVSLRDGTKLAEPVVMNLAGGEDYSVEVPEVEGYRPLQDAVTGTMPNKDWQVTVFMVAEGESRIGFGDLPVNLDDYGTPLGVGDSILGGGEIIE